MKVLDFCRSFWKSLELLADLERDFCLSFGKCVVEHASSSIVFESVSMFRGRRASSRLISALFRSCISTFDFLSHFLDEFLGF